MQLQPTKVLLPNLIGGIKPPWRKLRDSNPCAFWANGFQDRLVMTTSISFRLYKVDLNFLINFIYYILNKNKNQMIEAIFQTFLSIAAF